MDIWNDERAISTEMNQNDISSLRICDFKNRTRTRWQLRAGTVSICQMLKRIICHVQADSQHHATQLCTTLGDNAKTILHQFTNHISFHPLKLAIRLSEWLRMKRVRPLLTNAVSSEPTKCRLLRILFTHFISLCCILGAQSFSTITVIEIGFSGLHEFRPSKALRGIFQNNFLSIFTLTLHTIL